MHALMEKLLSKKKDGKPLDETYKSAKMKTLENLKDVMSGMIGDDIKGLKKVAVASNDDDGLKTGLEKAKEMLGEEEEDSAEEAQEETLSPSDHMSVEAIEEKIKELEALKAKKMMG